MRKIKFRCWDKYNKEMLDVENLYWEYNKLYIKTWMYNDYFNKEMILMQFTGLYDKNGKEIYEGDIVINNDYSIKPKSIIKYGIVNIPCCGCCYDYHKICGFYLEDITGRTDKLDENTLDKLEVIGNIYDNKDLLKREDKK